MVHAFCTDTVNGCGVHVHPHRGDCLLLPDNSLLVPEGDYSLVLSNHTGRTLATDVKLNADSVGTFLVRPQHTVRLSAPVHGLPLHFRRSQVVYIEVVFTPTVGAVLPPLQPQPALQEVPAPQVDASRQTRVLLRLVGHLDSKGIWDSTAGTA